MNTDLNMKVNVLPVFTYNFLHVNDSAINASDIEIKKLSSPKPGEVPQGVSLKSEVSFEEAGQIFRDNRRGSFLPPVFRESQTAILPQGTRNRPLEPVWELMWTI